MGKSALIVFGTRPEAIKMLPVVEALKAEPDLDVEVCITAQHRGMLDEILTLFEVAADYDLDVMTEGQGLPRLTNAVLSGVSDLLSARRYDWVVVHGDTTTTMATSLAAFYNKVPVAHVEAGLRSGDRAQPWPEEINRRFADMVSELYFAPTQSACDNLLSEHVPRSSIFVTGNTALDALIGTLDRLDARPKRLADLNKRFSFLDGSDLTILVTAHRRENFGQPFVELCTAIRDLAAHYKATVVYPVHPNPNVQKVVYEMLGDAESIHLIRPLDYVAFVYLMRRSDIIMTDSGGIQEEAPTLGKPVFVMRNVTERPEAVQAGTSRLVGTRHDAILSAVGEVISERGAYDRMSKVGNPFGDGQASRRIADVLVRGKTDEFSPS